MLVAAVGVFAAALAGAFALLHAGGGSGPGSAAAADGAVESARTPPPLERPKTFDEGRESMKMGWTGTFDQLAEYLAKA